MSSLTTALSLVGIVADACNIDNPLADFIQRHQFIDRVKLRLISLKELEYSPSIFNG
jgi:hypothetical protein